MNVIIQVRKVIAVELRKPEPRLSLFESLADVLGEFRVTIRPLHPTVDDETLQTYFVMTTPDEKTGDEIAFRLRECEGVDAAYVKRAAEDPS